MSFEWLMSFSWTKHESATDQPGKQQIDKHNVIELICLFQIPSAIYISIETPKTLITCFKTTV